ncbi:MAG: D-2-hydroxyacid dehydrogenase [Deltaproteobacteria bacterium]|jgi:glycerate dehydrogenase|nr:D-2-hydroxyacid dehydrogenase [Deltaproteobacteria bacterium]
MTNLVILDSSTVNPGDLSWDPIKNTVDKIAIFDRTPEELVIERAKDAELVMLKHTALGNDLIDKLPKLRYIGILTTGYDVVDVSYAGEKNITVTNIPEYSREAVAQYAIALLLEVCSHVGHHDDVVRTDKWRKHPDWTHWDFPIIELDKKIMGIIGYGAIGHTTGQICKAIGMKVVAFNSDFPPYDENDLGDIVSFDELITTSDVISLHVPLTSETEGYINKDLIARMKDRVIIINTARGGLIVERDLADALNSGKVYAAGLDVLIDEPPRPDNPLLSAKNCVITPHLAFSPMEARKRLIDIAAENVRRFLAGTPQNVIKPYDAD